MASVSRAPSILREMLNFDSRLRGAEVHTGGRRLGPQEPWRYFGAAGEPGLVSPWGLPNPADGVHNPRWFRDERNIVHLSGSVAASIEVTGNYTILIMPSGLRPTQYARWLAGSSVSPRYWSSVYMGSDGAFVAANLDPGSHWLSLDGLSYSLN